MGTPVREGKPSAGSVAWSDGSDFNGYALVGLKTMTGYTDTQFTWANTGIGYTLPKSNFTKLLITDGAYEQTAGLLYNADINPPGTYYVAWIYNSAGVQVAGPSSPFQVSSSPFTMPTFTLTAPSVSSNPTPNS